MFGPHPDDIEIGLGGTVAKHAALGHRVGLCDLTAGEMGSNGTVDERLAEAEAARAVLGAAWRVNLRLPDRAHRHSDPTHVRRSGRPRSRQRGRAPSRCRTGRIAIPITCAASAAADRGGLQRRPAAVSTPRARRGSRSGSATTSSTIHAPPSFVVDVSDALRHEAARAGVPRQPVRARAAPTPCARG